MSKNIAELIYNYRLSIECCGSWFVVYQGDNNRPVDRELKRVGFFTWEWQESKNIDKALAYSLSVTDAVNEAVGKINKTID